MKCNLLWFLALAQGCSNEVRVDSTGEFALAASVAEPGQVIIVADGVYSNLHLQVEAEEVTIKAKHPGKAIISGDSRVILDGDGIVFSGFYFKDGARNPDEWGSHGPGLVTVRGNHIRITECAFHQFDSVSSGWIVTMPRSMGEVPQFLRVDHCSFTNKPSFDQVVNFNNILRANWVAHRDEEGYVPPGPMYHRLDHCYFSNPKKKGNAGAGLRIGFSGDAGGRCLVDHNLFERQDSESEIITSKTPENIFFANTYRNCRGTMNFRGGARQIALRNYFLATDRLAEYGGMFIWDNDHVVTENYFHLLRTLQHRGGAVIYLNAGPDNSESVNGFPRVCNSLFANNIILVEQGAVFDLSGLLERRIEWAAQKHNLTDVEKFLPLGNVFSGNVMAVLDGSQEPIKFSGEIDLISRQNWRNNVLHSEWTNPVSHSGIALAALELKQYQAQGLLMPPVEVIEACYNPVSFEVDPHLVVDPRALLAGQIKRLKHSPDIDLRELDDAVRPLEFADVGPSWLKENPSTYVREAKVEGRLLDMMKESHKRRKLSYP